MRGALIVIGLAGCWRGQTTPARPEPPVEESGYRSTTIAVDAVGIGAMTAGLVGLSRGYDEDVSGGLLAVGSLSALAGPIIHLAHGNKARAGASYLVRSLAATTGLMVGMGISNPGRDQLFPDLTGMFWGATAGLAVGGALDALLLHDQPRSWVPTATPTDGGAQVGILGAF
jgi:hypothetical protein